jgi:hypothetical protein
MTEQEWLSSDDLGKLIYFLPSTGERKWRLFTVACCHTIQSLLHDRRSLNAIDVIERIADGEASSHELEVIHEAACEALAESKPERKKWPVEDIARVISLPKRDAKGSAQGTAGWVTLTVGQRAWKAAAGEKNRRWQKKTMRTAWNEERRRQCSLLRDIFHNPFQQFPCIDSAWVAWNDRTIHKLAHLIYDEKVFDRLPILADALEKAGCTNPDILNHCRMPGPHVRGCWVVDLLLGKE